MNPIMLHSFHSRAAEIMSKYRPIAPKPPSAKHLPTPTSTPPSDHALLRSTRSRKRSRGALLSLTLAPPSFKRSAPAGTTTTTRTTMSLLDLNSTAPEEKDLLRQLQDSDAVNVIEPQPVRPIGSTITILGFCSRERKEYTELRKDFEKKMTAVALESEVESEKLPTVISDGNNKVRVSNSAYKVLVGQPECSWLGLGGGGSLNGRIAGDVMLRHEDLRVTAEMVEKGFLCWARVEWGGHGNEKKWVNTLCEASRVRCDSKDYAFAWRFHIKANGISPREHST